MSLLSPRSFALLSTTESPITDPGSVVLILRDTFSAGLALSLLQEILIQKKVKHSTDLNSTVIFAAVNNSQEVGFLDYQAVIKTLDLLFLELLVHWGPQGVFFLGLLVTWINPEANRDTFHAAEQTGSLVMSAYKC